MSSILTSRSFTAPSAQVQMYVEAGGVKLRVAQLGPDFVILGKVSSDQLQRAEIGFGLDAKDRRWPVEMPHGLAGVNKRTLIVNRA